MLKLCKLTLQIFKFIKGEFSGIWKYFIVATFKLVFSYFSRCELLESMGANKDLLKACLTMLRCVQPESEQKMVEWVELAVRIARMHHASGHLHSARKALSNALVTCSAHFSMEHYNLLLELQILTKYYLDVIKVRIRNLGLFIVYSMLYYVISSNLYPGLE